MPGEKLYPSSIVSNDGHSLEVRNLQVGGGVHRHHRNSLCLRSSTGDSNSTAALEPFAVNRRQTSETVSLSLLSIIWALFFFLLCSIPRANGFYHVSSHRFSVLSSTCRWWAISWWRMGQSSATSNREISSRTCSSLVSDAKTFSAKAVMFSSVSARRAKCLAFLVTQMRRPRPHAWLNRTDQTAFRTSLLTTSSLLCRNMTAVWRERVGHDGLHLWHVKLLPCPKWCIQTPEHALNKCDQ